MLVETIAGDTPVHRLEPRVRILVVFAFALACSLLWRPSTSSVALGLGVGLCVFARIPWPVVYRRLLPLNVMLLFAVAGLLFGPGGAGPARGIALLLKANAILLAVTALLGTMEATALGHALQRLGMPEGLTRLLLFTVRYFEVFRRELERLRRTLRCRGFVPGLNLHTLRTYGYLVGMLLVRAFERAERVVQAMRCRGFTGRFPVLPAQPLRRADWVFAAGSGILLVALLWGERW